MSTSLLYHAFGIYGYQYRRTEYESGEGIFTIHQHPSTRRCSACGASEVVARGHVERRFRTLPIGSRPTFIKLPTPRVECLVCRVVRQVAIPFVDEALGEFQRVPLETPGEAPPSKARSTSAVDSARSEVRNVMSIG
jgi:hypothetical protein